MDNKKWDKFIEELDSEGFNKDLKEYLKAIKYVSEIKIKNIDDREEINSKLSIIVDFIEKYKEEYYEISLITGFKTNEKENDVWKINGRDYYYYIADQKMKASVYYIRYLNYIEKSFGESANAKKSLKDEIRKIPEVEKQLNYDSESWKDNVIDVINVLFGTGKSRN